MPGHQDSQQSWLSVIIIKKMVKDRKIIHNQKLASLESQGVTYVVADREFHCRYCNSYIKSNNCKDAKLHTRTSKHMNKQEQFVERNEAQRKLIQIHSFTRKSLVGIGRLEKA